MAMANVKNVYSHFYKELALFTDGIQARLKPNAPVGLSSNVKVLAAIIKPSNFGTSMEDIIKRIMLTFDLTELVLKKVDEYGYIKEDEDSKNWFHDTGNQLNMCIMVTKMALTSLRLEHSDIDVVVLGAGGINRGVYTTIKPNVLDSIETLIKSLG